MKKLCNILILFFFVTSQMLFTAEKSFAFSVADEREVGEKLLYSVRKNLDVLEELDLIQYIGRLGQQVLDVAGPQFFDYHFFIIDNKEFNAFAAPSGLIFFHSGLIEKVQSENELFSVLAHEVAHIVKRHISKRIDKGKKVSIATLGAVLAAIALGGGAGSEAIMASAMAAEQSAALHFSRIDEEEADRLAYDWMKKLGRAPEAQVNMLKTMRQIARYRSNMVPQYLLTHPNPETRLDYVQTLIDTEAKPGDYPEGNDNLQFLRFKARILTLVKDSMYLRSYYASILAAPNATDLEKDMASYGLSQLEREENNYSESLMILEKIITKFPDVNIFRVDKGVIQLEKGDIESGYATLKKAFKNDRKDMYCAYYLGIAAAMLNHNDVAQVQFDTVLYNMPYFSKVYFELGKLCDAEQKEDEAAYYLAKMYLMQGKLSVAKQGFERIKKSKKLSPELQDDINKSLQLIKRLNK